MAVSYKLTIAGCGPGGKDYLTRIAEKRIRDSEILIGHKRLLALFRHSKAKKIPIKSNYEEIINKIRNTYKKKKTVVLVTGDPGIHSYAQLMLKAIGANNCEVIPGISSIQVAFARVGLAWEDALIFSLHGEDMGNMMSVVRRNPKVAILTDDTNSPCKIARKLLRSKILDRRVFLCENLTLENERVREVNLEELKTIKPSGLNVVILVKE
jgi:precorrin-6y C5,15-methyltransferase (decarboxylating) CbiE subunit